MLTPTRNQENDYRIYHENEIKQLKTIKFLRELNVPIRELKQLQEETLTLQECLNDRIKKIEIEEKKYQKIKEMCVEIAKTNISFKEMNVTPYFQEMSKLNKEGFTMREVKTNKIKKILGAVLSSFLFGSVFFFLVGTLTYFQWISSDKIPWIIYIILMGFFSLPLIGIIYNLVKRIQEINGGEEDEASKY